jgi:hypothetical protein
MELYAMVKVVKLLRAPQEYDGWGINKRAPQIGDTGTYLELLRAPGLPDHYVVEAADLDGNAIWLGEFLREEIETIESQG